MNKAQITSIITHVSVGVGAAVGALATVGVFNANQASEISTALGQISTGLAQVVQGLSVLVTVGGTIYAAWRQTTSHQIASVNTEPNGVKVVAATSPSPMVTEPIVKTP